MSSNLGCFSMNWRIFFFALPSIRKLNLLTKKIIENYYEFRPYISFIEYFWQLIIAYQYFDNIQSVLWANCQQRLLDHLKLPWWNLDVDWLVQIHCFHLISNFPSLELLVIICSSRKLKNIHYISFCVMDYTIWRQQKAIIQYITYLEHNRKYHFTDFWYWWRKANFASTQN